MKRYYVYILFNHSRTLYVGVTSDLVVRIQQHKQKRFPGFTAKYRIDQLAYYESFRNVMAAIEREKQIKGWTRAKKIALIESRNPHWEDLTNTLYARAEGQVSQEAQDLDHGGQILRCAQDDSWSDLPPQERGIDSPGQVLRWAQNDTRHEGNNFEAH